ncbi:MAG: acyl-CoA thioesterase [Bacteroidia bacterium]|jgi:acyl-CoA thioester hydrolase|nr:acyl-CoA thioesterase [Bacteroidia bacterium]
MMVTETRIRVRYGETDQMGVVYHGNYALYFEEARTDALRQIGVSYKNLEKAGVMMPVVQLVMNYKKPATYDELLTIRTSLKTLPTVKIVLDYEVFNEVGEFLSSGSSTLVFVDMKTQRPVKCPAELYEKFSTFFK